MSVCPNGRSIETDGSIGVTVIVKAIAFCAAYSVDDFWIGL